MKLSLISGLILASSFAHASFELMTILDRYASGGAVIHRYDPVTGAFLGDFGKGILSTTNFNLALDQSGKTVIAGNYTGTASVPMLQFDYNSGQYLRDTGLGSGGVSTNISGGNGHINAAYGSQNGFNYLLDYDVNGTYLGFYSAPGTNLILGGTGGNGYTYALDQTHGMVHRWNTATRSYVGSTALPLANTFFYLGEIALRGNRMAFASSSSGTSTLWCADLDATGAPVFRTYNLSSLDSTAVHAVFGHNDDIYIGATAVGASTMSVQRFNFTNGAYRGTAISGLADVGGLSMVVAPEPGVWIGLGLGSLALMRRRKHRA